MAEAGWETPKKKGLFSLKGLPYAHQLLVVNYILRSTDDSQLS